LPAATQVAVDTEPTEEPTMPIALSAGHRFPDIAVPRLGGGEIELGVPGAGCDWQMIIVYRGKHCPICARYLGRLQDLLPRFHDLGIDVVAVSADPVEKAAAFVEEAGVTFPVGHSLGIAQMRALGLYISDPRSTKETDRPFAEPGLFVVDDARRMRVGDVSNASFTRPDLEQIANGLKFVRDNADYPIRGMHAA
jgi:peroxiredoxin